MTNRTSLPAFLAVALALGVALPASAQSGRTAAPAARLSNADAERIALREVPDSEVVELERDHERGREVIEVTVRDRHGVETELTLDASTGEILRREVDDD